MAVVVLITMILTGLASVFKPALLVIMLPILFLVNIWMGPPPRYPPLRPREVREDR